MPDCMMHTTLSHGQKMQRRMGFRPLSCNPHFILNVRPGRRLLRKASPSSSALSRSALAVSLCLPARPRGRHRGHSVACILPCRREVDRTQRPSNSLARVSIGVHRN